MAERTLYGSISELEDIKDKLTDFIEFVNKGKRSYLKDIALKLRLLFCYKSGTKSLIKNISEILEINIFVNISYTTEEKIKKGIFPKSLGEGLIFEQVNSVTCWFENGDELVNILDAISREEVSIKGEKHSYKKIIEVMADKMGGAHIDKKIKDNDLKLHSQNFFNRRTTYS